MLMEFSYKDLYIRHAYDSNPNDIDFKMHIHNMCEIYFFVSGSVEYIVEGSKYLLPQNSLMIMRPAEAHRARITASTGYERYVVNFSPYRFRDIDPEHRLLNAFWNRPLGKDNLFTENDIDTELILKLLKEICLEQDDYDQALTLNTHLPMLLNMINHAFLKRSVVEYKPMSTAEKMVYYVNSHLFDKLSIPQLASCFYLSPSQFSRNFKQATGSAPWDYIVKKRLAAANEKIRMGTPVQTAAETCGFSDYSSFYRAYTKLYGQSPKSSI